MGKPKKRFIIASAGTSSIEIVQLALLQAQEYVARMGEKAPVIDVYAFDTNRQIETIGNAQLKHVLVGKELQGDGSGMNLELAKQAFEDSKEEINSMLKGDQPDVPIGGAIVLAMPGVGASGTMIGQLLAGHLRDEMAVTTVPVLSWPSHRSRYIANTQLQRARQMRDSLFANRFHILQANMDAIHRPGASGLYSTAQTTLKTRLANEVFTLFKFWHEGRFTDPNDLKNQFLDGAGYLKVSTTTIGDRPMAEVVGDCFSQSLYQFEGVVRAASIFMEGPWLDTEVEQMFEHFDDQVQGIGAHLLYVLKHVPPTAEETEGPKNITVFLSSYIEPQTVPSGKRQLMIAGADTATQTQADESTILAITDMPVDLAPQPKHEPQRLSGAAARVLTAVYDSASMPARITYGALFAKAMSARGTDIATQQILAGPTPFAPILREIRSYLGDANAEGYTEPPSWLTLQHALLFNRTGAKKPTAEELAMAEPAGTSKKLPTEKPPAHLPKEWNSVEFLGSSREAWKLLLHFWPLQIFPDAESFNSVTFTHLLVEAEKGRPAASYYMEFGRPEAVEEILRVYRAYLGEGLDTPYNLDRELVHPTSTRLMAKIRSKRGDEASLGDAWVAYAFMKFLEQKRVFPYFEGKLKGRRFIFTKNMGTETMSYFLSNTPLGEKDKGPLVQECCDLAILHGEQYVNLWMPNPEEGRPKTLLESFYETYEGLSGNSPIRR